MRWFYFRGGTKFILLPLLVIEILRILRHAFPGILQVHRQDPAFPAAGTADPHLVTTSGAGIPIRFAW